MSLHVGDAVLVHINDESRSQRIGILEYIGYIDSHKRSKFVGINLVESVENGHNGTINGLQHFKATDGHGIYVRIQNIVKKLDCRQLTLKIQQILLIFKQRMNQYVSALSERDDYIEELKSSQRRLKKLLKSKKQTTNSNNNQPNSLRTITELMTRIPPPMSKMTSDDLPIPKEISKDNNKHNTKGRNKSHSNERNKRKKNCEYTKYSGKKSNVNCDIHAYYSSEDNIDSDDDDETSSSDSNITNDSNENNISNNIEESTDDDLTWCDDNGYVSSTYKKHEAPTPISISTINSRHSRSTNKSNKNGHYKLKNKNKYKQKSHSTHNTPHQSPTVNNLNTNNLRHVELMSKSMSPNQYHHNNNNNMQTIHQTSFSNQSYVPYNNGNNNGNNNVHQTSYSPYSPNDMMVSQQQNIIPPMQPVTRNQTVPNMHNGSQTKRRSLHKVQPIPELHHNKRVKKQKQQLKLRNRRSNSVDAFYFSEVQLKNQVVNLKNTNTQPCKDNNNNNNNNNNNIYNGNYNGNRQYVFQQPPQQFQYHNNSPPSDQIYTVTQPLQDHFSAYF